jgi:hypothetical protein
VISKISCFFTNVNVLLPLQADVLSIKSVVRKLNVNTRNKLLWFPFFCSSIPACHRRDYADLSNLARRLHSRSIATKVVAEFSKENKRNRNGATATRSVWHLGRFS